MENKVKNDISSLIEQTQFLLSKHQDSKDYCVSQFNEFLSLIEAEMANVVDDSAKLEKLKTISEIVTGQLKEFSKDINEDIAFLEDQIKAIEEIEGHEDPAAASKLLDVLMDGEKVPETKEFKEAIESEASASKQAFTQIVEDLKSSLQEGGIDELLAYLQDIEESGEVEDKSGLEVSLDFDGDEELASECCGTGKCDNCQCGDSCKCDMPTCES